MSNNYLMNKLMGTLPSKCVCLSYVFCSSYIGGLSSSITKLKLCKYCHGSYWAHIETGMFDQGYI